MPPQSLIAAMLTPALLILASASLIATVLVRLARIVDRVRALSAASGSAILPDELARQERRARLALGAVGAYFVAVVLFVLAGATIAIAAAVPSVGWLPVSLTILGMVLIVFGAGAMTLETRDSAALISGEIARLRERVNAV